MSKIVVCTSFSKEGFEIYGAKFLAQAERTLPTEARLLVVSEDDLPIEHLHVNLDAESDGFFTKNAHNDRAHGRGIETWMRVKDKDRRDGYSFRYDIYKFAKKIVCLKKALDWSLSQPEPANLFWIDGDVEFLRPIPIDFFNRVLPAGFDVCYLPREDNSPECGFVGYNIYSENSRAANIIYGMFSSIKHNTVFTDFEEWHDSYMFGALVDRLGAKYHSLSPTPAKGHVFNKSPILNPYMRHNKGDMKYRRAK